MSFYAVRSGRIPGIYMTWSECEAQVKGFPNARYKKFPTKNEAIEFINASDDPYKHNYAKANSSESVGPAKKFNGVEFTNWNSDDANVKTKTKSNVVASAPKSKKQKVENTDLFSCYSDVNQLDSDLDLESDDEDLDEFEKIKEQLKQAVAKKVPFSFNNQVVSVYTDGACSKNGRKGASAGVGIFWGVSHPLNISRKLIGRQTNNRAEITAAIIAISQAIQYNAKEIILYTDSQFMINCMTKWINKWKVNDWKLATGESVKNIPDLKYLDSLCSKIKVYWKYVTAHKGIFGNEEADRLARLALQH